jgi:hypothetical protein
MVRDGEIKRGGVAETGDWLFRGVSPFTGLAVAIDEAADHGTRSRHRWRGEAGSDHIAAPPVLTG